MEKIKKGFSVPDNIETRITSEGIISHGINGLNLKEAARERYFYIIGGTPDNLPEGFDLFDGKLSYGKLNTKNQVILPKFEQMAKVESQYTDEDDLYLNKITYEFFKNVFEDIKLSMAFNKGDMAIFSSALQIHKAAEAPEEIYEKYRLKTSEMIQEAFTLEVMDPSTNIKDDIKNFHEYLDVITRLIRSKKIPKDVLFSEYVLNPENLITNSGLMFEVDNNGVEYDENEKKWMTFFTTSTYSQVIARFLMKGLRYDRNVPWRFVLDMNHKNFKNLAGGKEAFFEENFDVVEGSLVEMELFYDSVHMAYQSLLEEYPVYTKTKQSFWCNNPGFNSKKSVSKMYVRRPFDYVNLRDLLDDKFNVTLKKYAIMLNSLFNGDKNKKFILFLKDLARQLKKDLDKETLISYTFGKIKNFK